MPTSVLLARSIATIAVCAGLLLGACSSSEGLLGAELFEQSCSGCHGDDGGGGIALAIGAGTPSVELTDEQLTGIIEIGPGSMPGYDRTLSDEQISSLVAYLRELQRAD